MTPKPSPITTFHSAQRKRFHAILQQSARSATLGPREVRTPKPLDVRPISETDFEPKGRMSHDAAGNTCLTGTSDGMRRRDRELSHSVVI